jgi:hypothetical protein
LRTFKDCSARKQQRITQLREDITQALHQQSKALFESDWTAAQNDCENIIELADELNGEIYEIQRGQTK